MAHCNNFILCGTSAQPANSSANDKNKEYLPPYKELRTSSAKIGKNETQNESGLTFSARVHLWKKETANEQNRYWLNYKDRKIEIDRQNEILLIKMKQVNQA